MSRAAPGNQRSSAGRPTTFSGALVTTGLANLANPLSAILVAPVLAQALGVDGRGAVAAATVPVALAATVAMLGLPEAATHAIAGRRDRPGQALRRVGMMLLGSGAIATVAVILAAPVVADGKEGLTRLIVASAATIIPALLVGALRGGATGMHAWRLVNAEKYAGAAIRLILIPLFAATGILDRATAVAIIAGSPVVAGLVYLRLPRYSSEHNSSDESATPQGAWSDLAHYGMRLWIGTLSGVILSRLDQVLMNPLSSVRELGLYVVAVNVADVALVLHNGVRDVVFASESKQADRSRVLMAARLSGATAWLAALALGATMPFWLTKVFGDAFAPAIAPALILLAAGALGVPGSIAGAMLSAAGRPGLRSASMAVAAVVNVALIFVTVPMWGALGAAVATVAGNLVASNVNLLILRRLEAVPIRNFYSLRRHDLATATGYLNRARKRSA
jgi:O-antigen/teichoic acid export membrane protein